MTTKQVFTLVSAWPDGVCCETCKHWSSYDLGVGYCEAVNKSKYTRLSDCGGLVTTPTFACLNWASKSDAAPVATTDGEQG